MKLLRLVLVFVACCTVLLGSLFLYEINLGDGNPSFILTTLCTFIASLVAFKVAARNAPEFIESRKHFAIFILVIICVLFEVVTMLPLVVVGGLAPSLLALNLIVAPWHYLVIYLGVRTVASKLRKQIDPALAAS